MENPPDDQLREAFKKKCREVFALEDRIEELEARLVEWRRDAEMWRRQKNGWIKEEETNQYAERQDEKEQP
jgi:predicted nuclease with TOPRIM domain